MFCTLVLALDVVPVLFNNSLKWIVNSSMFWSEDMSFLLRMEKFVCIHLLVSFIDFIFKRTK